jgi:hypothetical protein
LNEFNIIKISNNPMVKKYDKMMFSCHLPQSTTADTPASVFETVVAAAVATSALMIVSTGVISGRPIFTSNKEIK